MIVSGSVRRVGAALIGVASPAVFAVGCASVSNGHPVSAGNSSVPSSAASSTTSSAPTGLPSGLPSVSVSIPIPSGSVPVLGGPPFCKAMTGTDLSSLGSAGSADMGKLAAAWDKLAAAAPSEIKSDVQLVDDFLHGVAAGTPDASKAQQVGTAIGHITTWVATNCH